MQFDTKKDKGTYIEIKKHLSRANIREQLRKLRKTLDDFDRKFHYHHGDYSLVDEQCVGRDYQELVNTDCYKNVTLEALTYEPFVPLEQEKPMPKKPHKSHGWFGFSFKEYFTDVLRWNWKAFWIAFSIIVLALPMVASAIAAIANDADTSGTIQMNSYLNFITSITFTNGFAQSVSHYYSGITAAHYILMGYLVFLFCFILFLVVPIIYAIKETIKMKKFEEKELREYQETVDKVNAENEIIRERRERNRDLEIMRLKRENLRKTMQNANLFAANYQKLVDLRKLKRIITHHLDTLDKEDRLYFESGILHKKYINDLVALSSFVDYFDTGRCTHFEGAGGAIDIYETEVYRKLVICKFENIEDGLSSISDKLTKISATQATLAKSVERINKSVDACNLRLTYLINSVDYHANEIIEAIDNIPAPVIEGTIYDHGYVVGSFS